METRVDLYLQEGCGRCPLGGTPQCKVHNWSVELYLLRGILLGCGLTEEVKWGVPCYTINNGNVIILSAFKDFCALSFFKGVLMKDEMNILERPGPNTQAARVIKFTDPNEIMNREDILRSYILEAIEIERSGRKVEMKDPGNMDIPEEFHLRLENDPYLKEAFESLTPGRQRGYLLFFSAPKQSRTKISRIEKCIPNILNGKGLHDR